MMPSPPVLIVDDDPDIRETLSDLLLFEGYDVESAARAQRPLNRSARSALALPCWISNCPIWTGCRS